VLGRLAAADRPVLWRLARWADDGDSDMVRVNAAGVLAKTGDLEFAGLSATVLGRDSEVKARYLRAMVARVGRDTGRLSIEVLNQPWTAKSPGTGAARSGKRGLCPLNLWAPLQPNPVCPGQPQT
jgi:hypothetical protein